MKKTKKPLALLAALLLLLAVFPASAMAVDQAHVTVSVMNNTYREGPWTGVLFETEVALAPGMTVEQAIRDAFAAEGQSIDWINYGSEDAPWWFIREIAGLDQIEDSEVPGGGWNMSGWMVAVNNWFSLSGLSAMADAGDYITVEFTMDGGPDLDAPWEGTDKSLKGVGYPGLLDPAFDPAITEYELQVPLGTESLVLQPQAANRNFSTTTKIGDTEYKWNQSIPVVEGTVITVICGDGSQDTDKVYTFTIAFAAAVDDGEDGEITSELDKSANTGDPGAAGMGWMALMGVCLAGAGLTLAGARRTGQ